MKINPWLLPLPVFAPEDGGAGDSTSTAESVLFPNEGEPAEESAEGKPAEGAPEGDGQQSAGDEGKQGEGEGEAEEWQEYVPDPNKSDEENAAAKAEHDKLKPPDEPNITVPEKYDLKMPDGIELDAAMLEAVTPVFKDLYLTNDQAQALTDKFIEFSQSKAQADAEAFATTVAGWADEARKDPEIGGAKWDQSVKHATGVVNRFGDPALKEYLNSTGAGNHPAMIRFMARVGALIGEDQPGPSNESGRSQPAEPAHVLFKNDAPKG